MSSSIQIPNEEWLITTLAAPMLFNRGKTETWYLNPVRRYLFNRAHVQKFDFNVESVSSVNGSALFKPLQIGRPLNGRRIFVERFRDRGIGDLLFLTGPFAYLNSITGGNVRIHTYAFSDRGAVLQSNPHIEHGTAFVGPTHFDDFQHYHYQWLVNSVTESDQENDQLNVYDALYRQLGLDPCVIEPKFKRPTVVIDRQEIADLQQFFQNFWEDRTIDLRKTGYYVAAPLTHSPLRLAPYSLWLEVIAELAKKRPVFVIGETTEPIPETDMSAGEFLAKVDELGVGVANLVNKQTKLRFAMSLISQATALIGLDSGPLYIAQGCRVPAVSLWGPHDPGFRIGYDPDYMDLAVWNQELCSESPCFAFDRFPARKCPHGAEQKICQVLRGIAADDVLKKVDLIEGQRSARVVMSVKHSQTNEKSTTPGAAVDSTNRAGAV